MNPQDNYFMPHNNPPSIIIPNLHNNSDNPDISTVEDEMDDFASLNQELSHINSATNLDYCCSNSEYSPETSISPAPSASSNSSSSSIVSINGVHNICNNSNNNPNNITPRSISSGESSVRSSISSCSDLIIRSSSSNSNIPMDMSHFLSWITPSARSSPLVNGNNYNNKLSLFAGEYENSLFSSPIPKFNLGNSSNSRSSSPCKMNEFDNFHLDNNNNRNNNQFSMYNNNTSNTINYNNNNNNNSHLLVNPSPIPELLPICIWQVLNPMHDRNRCIEVQKYHLVHLVDPENRYDLYNRLNKFCAYHQFSARCYRGKKCSADHTKRVELDCSNGNIYVNRVLQDWKIDLRYVQIYK
jgi:hypothetical protein